MYGECRLDVLSQFETPDRSQLAEAPLTRALEEWIRVQIFDYEAEFKKLDRLSASQEQRNRLQDLNQLLDQWKNRFLDEMSYGTGGTGRGGGIRPRPKPRPLPQRTAIKAMVDSPFSKAGLGVWLRMRTLFLDDAGVRVAAPAFLWHSSDWAVATVDDNRLVTHAPGRVQVWIETIDAKIRSNVVEITVLDTVSSRVEPNSVQVKAGSILQLNAAVKDRDGIEHWDVYMTWVQDDSSVVEITSTGKLIAQKQGRTKVYALDERTMNHTAPGEVEVIAADILPGEKPGKSYPRILLSEVDPDPLNPDGDTVHLSAEDGPVHQPTPQHVEHNIWWINLQCPLAKLYFEEFGPESREWRSYHIERYIEALAKIHLSHDFQVAEQELTFDEIERRWREVAAEVQRRALEDLRNILPKIV
jgi:hypothetical protein